MFYKPNNNIIYFTFINNNSKYKFKRFHGSLKIQLIMKFAVYLNFMEFSRLKLVINIHGTEKLSDSSLRQIRFHTCGVDVIISIADYVKLGVLSNRNYSDFPCILASF